MFGPTISFEQSEPPEFTEFSSSTACNRDDDHANLHLVQAFVAAYNDRDKDRLVDLDSSGSSPIAGPLSIADMSGIPHLGEDDWTEVSDWADRGWSVDDRFELTRLVMYDGGSVFELERSNDVLRANGIESLHHFGKVHSSRCSISQLVLYLPDAVAPGVT